MKIKRMFAVVLLTGLLASGCAAGDSGNAEPGAADGAAETPAPAEEQWYGDTVDEESEDYWGEPESAAGERYLTIQENQEKLTEEESLLTFSLKVDTASYTNAARYIQSGSLPPADAVRIEELINYFRYDQALSYGEHPFALYTEIGPSPFHSEKHLAFVRVKTEDIDKRDLPPSSITFLIDTSGSMDSYDKLPLLQDAFTLLTNTLDENDRVSIVTYAGSSDVVLDGVSGAERNIILKAIHDLQAEGSTAGAQGIQTAYDLARKNFIQGGNNRVVLATDGDFNVGMDTVEELEEFIGEQKESGVYLSVLGFGTGNIREDIMETLSQHGNGNYSYINSVSTAQKVLVEELAANLFTVADDVKAQIQFEAENVRSYRLIGYENRRLRNEDFDDDTKDAGEIGAGTDVVMLFELELEPGLPGRTDELFEVRIRYKNPGEDESKLVTQPVFFSGTPASNTSDFRFASAVAGYGHLLRDSRYTGTLTLEDVMGQAEESLGRDDGGYRQEFLDLLEQYQKLVR